MVRPGKLAAAALALVALAGVRAHPGAGDDTLAALPAAEDGANLDWAVDTSGGAWCSAPLARPRLRALPFTLEGWVRDHGAASAGVLIEISDVAARRSLVRLSLEPDPVGRRMWTHYALAAGNGHATLTTWDAARGERRVLSAPVAMAGGGPVQVCVGGAAGGGESFAGLVDEVRVWAAELPAAEIRAWRHRRVTRAHPFRSALAGYWPFRAGRGPIAEDEAESAPLQAASAVWVPLPRLDYGPLLRAVDRRSARFLFHARDPTGAEREWAGSIEIGTEAALGGDGTVITPPVRAREADDHVAHVGHDGLLPQTRYHYAPLVDGRRGLDPGPGGFPSFLTLPELGGRNADFTAVFLADQHVRDAAPRLEPYAAAEAARPLFWAQLGDVAAGNLDGVTAEHRRDRAHLQRLWERNYAPGTPQAAFASRFGLNLATISDHEVEDNFSLNWHLYPYGRARDAAAATLQDRVFQYDRSLARWWSYLGWGDSFDDRLGRVARSDRGESVMAEAPVAASAEAGGPRACLDRASAGAFAPGDFVSLADAAPDVWHTRVVRTGAEARCSGGWGVTVADAAPRAFRAEEGATLAVGARYARHGLYRAFSPFPFVEFFVADTTSFRGDPYQKKDVYAADANRDTDHARYPWNAAAGALFIHGDRPHGANRTTDGVRSWLGPRQKGALLAALRSSTAGVLVVTAGYPLYSVKFEGSRRYWEGRESGFDFATEVQEIVSALEGLDRLVLWVHGDGHTPALVRLRRNVYQLQVGATQPSSDRPGHRSRNLISGSRSTRDSIGGGYLIAGHQPDLAVGDGVDDIFEAGLDQFAGYLRLYFHPGQEALRSVETAGLRRGASAREVVIPAADEPALGAAARLVAGRVVRLRFADRSLHSVVSAYRYEPGQAVLTLQDPVVEQAPDELRVLIDAAPWVEARWFDARGREWRDFTFVMRKDL